MWIVLVRDDNDFRKLSSMSQINDIVVRALHENKPKYCIVQFILPMNINIADVIKSVQCDARGQ